MSHEAECAAYAVCGDPARDAADYEESARYDRFDGWTDPYLGSDDPQYEDCDDPDNAEADAYLQSWIESERREHGIACADNDDCPF